MLCKMKLFIIFIYIFLLIIDLDLINSSGSIFNQNTWIDLEDSNNDFKQPMNYLSESWKDPNAEIFVGT